jgi:hypothetical protein
VSFVTITLSVASERVFIVVSVYFIMTQSGNFWIHPRTVCSDVGLGSTVLKLLQKKDIR